VVAARKVTVLTSSTADRGSREDEKWGHGAFTEVLLDALSEPAGIGKNRGLITMTDLTAYMEEHLSQLTGGDQELGIHLSFQSSIFIPMLQ
jgi:hypothetical protein